MRCLCFASRHTIDPGPARQIRFTARRWEDPLSPREDLLTIDQHRRREFIEGLRAVARFYEENPGAWYDGMHLTLNMYVWGRTARKTLAETARAFGQCNKVYDDN